MFPISKNPQATMVEVLAKAEKCINGEEALTSKWESSSAHKEKSRGDKKRERSPKRQGNRDRSPTKGRREQRTIPEETRQRQGPPGSTSARATAMLPILAVHSPDSLCITGLTRGTTREIPQVAIPDKDSSHKKRYDQVL